MWRRITGVRTPSREISSSLEHDNLVMLHVRGSVDEVAVVLGVVDRHFGLVPGKPADGLQVVPKGYDGHPGHLKQPVDLFIGVGTGCRSYRNGDR